MMSVAMLSTLTVTPFSVAHCCASGVIAAARFWSAQISRVAPLFDAAALAPALAPALALASVLAAGLAAALASVLAAAACAAALAAVLAAALAAVEAPPPPLLLHALMMTIIATSNAPIRFVTFFSSDDSMDGRSCLLHRLLRGSRMNTDAADGSEASHLDRRATDPGCPAGRCPQRWDAWICLIQCPQLQLRDVRQRRLLTMSDADCRPTRLRGQ